MAVTIPPKDFKERCFELRGLIKDLKLNTEALALHPVFSEEQSGPNQHSEMKANVKLAYRHLEDARMRFGKAVQAYDGGTSCYPR